MGGAHICEMATKVLTHVIWMLLFIVTAGLRIEAQVALMSSVEGHAVCEGVTVTYTCSVTGGPVLEWRAPPFIPSMDIPLTFLLTDPIGLSTEREPSFVATLTNNTVDMNGVSTLTSELAAQAEASINGTLISCTNQRAFQTEQLIVLTEPPLAPTDLVCSAVSYNCSTASAKADVLCNWREPDGNVPPISYNFSVDNEPPQVLMETSISILLDCEDPNRTFTVATTDGCGLSSNNSVSGLQLIIDECKAQCTMVLSDGLTSSVVAGIVIAVLVPAAAVLVVVIVLSLLLYTRKRKSYNPIKEDTEQMKGPPAPPIFLAVSEVDENSAVFHWKLPDDENDRSSPTQVVITVMYMDDTVCTEKTISIIDGTDHARVTGLDPGVQYIASIKTCSSDGMESATVTTLSGQSEGCDSALMNKKDEAESNIGSDSELNEHNQNIQQCKHSSVQRPEAFCTKIPADFMVKEVTQLTVKLKWKQWYETREKCPDAVTITIDGKEKTIDVQSETETELEVLPDQSYEVYLTSTFKRGTVSTLPIKFKTPVLFPVMAETEIELKEKARQFVWVEQGITLQKMTKFGSSTVKVKSCQPNCREIFHKCMSDSEAVSVVYEISMKEEVTLSLKISHCLQNNNTRSVQQFVTSSTSCWPPIFTIASSKVSIQESMSEITVSRPCWVAIIAKRDSQKKLCAHVYHQPESPLKHKVFLTFTVNLPIFTKILNEKFANHTKILELPGVASANVSKIILDLPSGGSIMDSQWHISHLATSVIFLKEVTQLITMDPPCFELLLESTEYNEPLLQYLIKINGISTCVPVLIQLQLKREVSDGIKPPSLSHLLSSGVVKAATDKWKMVALALGVGDQIASIQAKYPLLHAQSLENCALEVFSQWLKKSIRCNLGEIVAKTIVVADCLKLFGVVTDELRDFSSTMKKVIMIPNKSLLDTEDEESLLDTEDEANLYTALEDKTPKSLNDIKEHGFFTRAVKCERLFAVALDMGEYCTYIMDSKRHKTEKLFTVWLRNDVNVSWDQLRAAVKKAGTKIV